MVVIFFLKKGTYIYHIHYYISVMLLLTSRERIPFKILQLDFNQGEKKGTDIYHILYFIQFYYC
jgi:hypothetical protein